MSRKSRICCICACVALSFALIILLGRLTQPKYMDDVPEGALIQEYYNETTSHDVIFVGDCEVYENFSPAAMWEEYGVNAYIRGSPQQLIWQSYWLLEETFSIESPQIVVYNVQSMRYSEPQSEAYNRMTLDGMRLSRYKIHSILDSMTGDESFISYIFPLLRYHSRITELSRSDLKYMFHRESVGVSGYLVQTGCVPLTRLPSAPVLSDYTIGEKCWDYLDRMRKLCEENGAELILIKSSSVWPYWYDEWDEQITQYAEKYNLSYINFIPLQEEIGIDFSTDTYDGGLHLNVYGAEKLGRYFARILRDEYSVPDRRSDPQISAAWEEKLARYYSLRGE